VVGAIIGATIGDNTKIPLSVRILICIFIEYDWIMYRTMNGRKKKLFIDLKTLPLQFGRKK
jgi:hypothetical protein